MQLPIPWGKAVDQMNALDILLLLLFLRALWMGFRRGFWQAAAGLFSVLIGLWAAVHYRADLARYLDEQLLLGPRLSDWLLKRLGAPSPGIGPETAPASNPYLVELTRDFPFSESWQKLFSLNVIDSISAAGQQTAQKMLGLLSQEVARLVLDGAAFLLILFAVWFGISLIFRLLGFFMSRGMLGLTNRCLGGAFALASQGLVLALVFGLLDPVWPVVTYLGEGRQSDLWTLVGTSLETSQLVPVLVNVYRLIAAWLFGPV